MNGRVKVSETDFFIGLRDEIAEIIPNNIHIYDILFIILCSQETAGPNRRSSGIKTV